ncbi:MAG: hypothetical protein J6A04_03105 [Clostridia bacterium]|nr:hypothetical protein [Clostridia bacterium]
MENINGFSNEAIQELQYYVYKLIDPRNGKVFYIGKGKGNRVFSHVNGWQGYNYELTQEDEEEKENSKMNIISQIKSAGLEVIHIIHRHGMDENTAFEVESALIDEYSSEFSNKQGSRNTDRRPANCNQINELYSLPVIENFNAEDKLLLIKIRQDNVDTWGNGSIYETVHQWWKINKYRINDIKQVAAVINGVVKNVYSVNDWYYNENMNRWGFNGTEIENSPYKNKRIPNDYMKKGQANPILYTF